MAADAGDAGTQFCVPATMSLQERRPRTLKYGDTFAVFDHNGDALSGPGSPEGIFHRDTRHLSHLCLTIEGARPILLSSTLNDDNAILTCDLTNPDIHDASGHVVLAHDLLHIRRSRLLWRGACHERVLVRNFDDRPRQVTVGIAFDADFADIFEVRGMQRDRRGARQAPEVTARTVVLSYVGRDRRRRATTLRFDPAPDRLEASMAQFTLDIAPQQARSLFVEIRCSGDGCEGTEKAPLDSRQARHFFRALREARRALRQSASRAASIVTSNDIFNEAVRRSISDLYMLATDTPEGPVPYAGLPWYSTVFGRDALITAMQMLWADPEFARGVLLHLAATQAEVSDPEADAEPGKILHEMRVGEMAELREIPFRRYYGSVDATPLFVMLAGAYFERSGDLATLRRLWPHILAALEWIGRHGDRDGDGFVEYHRQTPDGLVNQGWKDSHDSVFHADGSAARGPIALVEVQAYVYGAWRAAAMLAHRLGDADRATEWQARAAELRRQFDASFFDPALGTYGLALDGDKRLCRVRTSNAGHALWTGIALPDRAGEVVRSLMSESSFCGWGVRTVASTEIRYNPMSYHNGSVWPHDNAILAAGFARYGFHGEAARIFAGLFAASAYIDLRRLPELFCGFPRQRARGPTFYPVACMPQAWAAAAPLSMLQSCLGLGFDPDEGRITFDHPFMPDFLGEVVLRNLAVGGASADVALRGSGRQVVVEVLRRRGRVQVVTTS